MIKKKKKKTGLWTKTAGNIIYVYHQADKKCTIHDTNVRATGIEISIVLPLKHRFKLQLILSIVANYLSHVLQ